MKKLFFGLTVLSSLSLCAQETPISVYDCSLYTPPTQAEVLGGGSTFTRGCIDLVDPGNYVFQQVGSKTLKSGSYIHADANCHVGPYTGTSSMRWQLQPTASPFDVAVMNYDDLDNVEKLKLLELGVQIPADILTKINNFISNSGNPATDQLNPFLDWQVDAEAVFARDGFEESKVIDGFYFRNFTRNTTTNDWDGVPTNYPFRIRYSPPSTGLWYCTINIKVNGAYVYFSNPFSFKVIETGAHGYVQVHDNNRNFELDGRIIMPMGHSFVGPYNQTESYIPPNATNKVAKVNSWIAYHQDIADYFEAGGRYIRTSQWAKSCLIEFEKKGNYYDRLHYAWETDQYIKYCDEHNMFVNFNLLFQEPLMQYGQYGETIWDFGHYVWDPVNHTHYYDSADQYLPYCYNDSGTEEPRNMFTDELDLKYHEQRTRYYIARYGYSTSIMEFELISEPYHLDEFYRPDGGLTFGSNSNSFEWQTNLHGDQVREALDTYNNRISTYIKNTMGHQEHLIGIHMFDNTIFPGFGFGDLDDPSLSLGTIDVVGVSTYKKEPQRFIVKKDSYGVQIDSDENSFYRRAKYYSETYGKLFIHTEQGAIGDINADDCSNFAVHNIDISSIGFMGSAAVYAWEGKEHYTGVDNRIAFPATIRAQNWMNSDMVIDVLSANNGHWIQGRQSEKVSAFDNVKLKEHQYYENDNQEIAVGYVYNRTYNYFTKGTAECSYYAQNPGHEFNDLRSFDWTDGPNNLFVDLKFNTDYKITWYDYLTGDEISNDCYSTGLNYDFKLKFPELTVVDPVIDRPLMWYKIEEYNCQQEKGVNNPTEEVDRNRELIKSINEDFGSVIYPNPFQKYLEIKTIEQCEIDVYSSNNELLYHTDLLKGTNTLNLDFLSKGVYFIKLSTRDDLIKIVKI